MLSPALSNSAPPPHQSRGVKKQRAQLIVPRRAANVRGPPVGPLTPVQEGPPSPAPVAPGAAGRPSRFTIRRVEERSAAVTEDGGNLVPSDTRNGRDNSQVSDGWPRRIFVIVTTRKFLS